MFDRLSGGEAKIFLLFSFVSLSKRIFEEVLRDATFFFFVRVECSMDWLMDLFLRRENFEKA